MKKNSENLVQLGPSKIYTVGKVLKNFAIGINHRNKRFMLSLLLNEIIGIVFLKHFA